MGYLGESLPLPTALSHLLRLKGFRSRKGNLGESSGRCWPHSPKTLISSRSGHFIHILTVIFWEALAGLI